VSASIDVFRCEGAAQKKPGFRYRWGKNSVSNARMTMFSGRASSAGWGALLFLGALTAPARAEEDAGAPNLLVNVPDDAPSGRMVEHGPSRPRLPRRACSFEAAVCVSGEVGDEATVLAALRHAEHAIRGLRGPLRFVAPDGDLESGAYEIALTDIPGELEIVMIERDPRSPLDRASGYAKLSRRLSEGCPLAVAVTRAVVRGVLLRSAPGADEGSAQAEAQAVTELLEPCAPLRASASYASFQEHPERALVSRVLGDEGERFEARYEPTAGARDARLGATQAVGSALFFRWLDRSFATEPGAVLRGLFALRGAKTASDARRFTNEPDTFDVLGKSFKDKLFDGSTLDDLVVDFAVSRARFGEPGQGGATAALGDAPRVRIDWDVPWPVAARRLAPAYPIEPTGSSYVIVRTDGAPKGARLRLEAAWEDHAKMRVAFARLDASGKELSRARVNAPPTAREAQMTVAELDGTARVVVVTTNVGDPAFHFDPDDVVHEPHGYTLTVLAE